MGKLQEVLKHPDELVPLMQMLVSDYYTKIVPRDPGLGFCYRMLNKVSRSFAIVIQQLPELLRDPICVFYLVLRALDTVEDDMALPNDIKLPLLRAFHKKIYDRKWSMKCGYGPYVQLMEEYPMVTGVFLKLDPGPREVITEICRKMGAGMAEFIPKEVLTVKDYDQYCHYAAGLVGEGLSKLAVGSGLENPVLLQKEDLSNHMGLFLQKTNIVRDYLEDINEEPAPRMFWPKEIWGKYTKDLADFKDPANEKGAVQCLNHMVTDALRHGEHALKYMALLRDPQYFNFCAIPQVMAFGTLSLCYNNPQVFKGVVKLRKGESAKLMTTVKSMPALYRTFLRMADDMVARCKGEARQDPNVATTLKRLQAIQAVCKTGLRSSIKSRKKQAATPLSDDFISKLVLVLGLGYCVYAFNLLPLLWKSALIPGPPPPALTSSLGLPHQIIAVFCVLTAGYQVFLRGGLA
uniref:Squalene synthase LSS n=1 Tax=Botryococcus braunii TaxID=38881 RepID=LSS_BOTBR|nr:RecName: Full=Squalene synthase LSS [Botryococcus braunii]AMV49168.1 squalene synthase [Botryococcus braunii]